MNSLQSQSVVAKLKRIPEIQSRMVFGKDEMNSLDCLKVKKMKLQQNQNQGNSKPEEGFESGFIL
jgi:hypothetical protein